MSFHPKFKLEMDIEEFLNKVYHSNFFSDIAKDKTTIISPRDIHNLQKIINEKPYFISIPQEDLEMLIQSIPNGEKKHPYEDAEIEVGKISPKLAKYMQTFVHRDKLISLGGLEEMLYEYASFPGGISKTSAFVISLGEYMAIYLPPIAEVLSFESISESLSVAEERLNEGEDKIKFNVINGDEYLSLHEVVKYNKKLFEKNEEVLAFRDGTHRNKLNEIAGTTSTFIKITEVESYSPLLLHSEMIKIVKEKPEKRNRFLGIDERNKRKIWIDYKGVGIDG